MGYVKALDVSRWQGTINWPAVKGAGYEIAVIKVTGSDNGDYVDPMAGINYDSARNAGLAFGTYHFAGGTDARHEAEYFVNVCSPLDENQVLVLDWEVQHSDPVGWCKIFVDRVKELTGIWPIIYMNGSTWNSRDWSPVTNNCGVWVAWYDRDPNVDLPVKGTYIMHQYTSSGSVPGIATRVDLDAWYSSVDVWNKYGYHAPVAPPVQPPVVTPPVEPPVVTPPIEPPVVTPPVVPPVVDPPVVTPPIITPPSQSLWDVIIALFTKIKDWLTGWRKG